MSDPQNDKLIEHLRRVSGKTGSLVVVLATGFFVLIATLWFWEAGRWVAVMNPVTNVEIPAIVILTTGLHLGGAICFTVMAITLPLCFIALRKRNRLIVDMWERIKDLENRLGSAA